MLKQLQISHFALIDKLDIRFEPGFSVITGETGAGKSIILGAIGLLLGQRADSKSIKTGAQKCIIEAHFKLEGYGLKEWFDSNELDYDDDDCVIRRELTSAGKSRGFINDTPVSLHLMRELGDMLMDVHSQHQNLLLQKEDFQLNTIDIIAGNSTEKETYSQTYEKFCKVSKELEQLKIEIAENRKNEDFMRFQLTELTNAGLIEGELEELETELESANHTEDIKSALYEADQLMNGDSAGIVSLLKSASRCIDNIEGVYPKISEIAERLRSNYEEIKDIASDISYAADDVDFDPKRHEFINERIETLYSLLKKHSCNTIAELIEEREKLQKSIDSVDNSEEEIERMQILTEKLHEETVKHAKRLSETREKAAKIVIDEMHSRLTSLGMPNVQFGVNISKGPVGKDGMDRIAFMFSANKGMEMKPVAQVASGGEIARVMLSLKAMTSNFVKLPTIVFDEIDTGVSGKVAEKMADIMCNMGEAGRQVISITHLPQIAAKGRLHYRVEKSDNGERTTSVMYKLDNEQRIKEVAQMMSGEDISEAAINNAKMLLGL